MSSGSLCSWLAAEGAHCRDSWAGLKAGRGGHPEQSGQRLPGGGGSHLEHPRSRNLPSSWPRSHPPFCQGPGWSNCTAAAPQPLPSCLAVCCLVQAAVSSRPCDFSHPSYPPLLITFLLSGWPPLFSFTTSEPPQSRSAWSSNWSEFWLLLTTSKTLQGYQSPLAQTHESNCPF